MATGISPEERNGEPDDHPDPGAAVTVAEDAAVGDGARASCSGGGPVPPGSMLAAAGATSAWAAVVSFAPVLVMVLLAWLGAGTASAAAAVKFALAGWLLAHGTPFVAEHGPVGLAPLAITAFIVWRVFRAGAHTARATGATPRDTPHVVVAVMVTYGAIGSMAALIASSPQFQVSPLRAFLTTAGLAGLSTTPGALSETGAAAGIWQWLPAVVRDGLRFGVIAALVIVASGAALVGVATVLAYQDAVDLYGAYHVGAVGGAGITLVCLLFLPNLVVWATSYLVGPGFVFGVGTEVTLFQVSLGPLPAVPALAGLPTGPAPGPVAVLLVTPALVGMTAGVLLARRHPQCGAAPLSGAATLTGLTAGLLLGAVSFAASGPLGAGRLADVGPAGWLVALVTLGVVGGGALIASAMCRALAIGRHGGADRRGR